MIMARNDKIKRGRTAHWIGACLGALVCAAPAAAHAQAQSDLVFGQKSTQPGLLNRMFGGARDPEPAPQAAGAPSTGAPASGQAAGGAAGGNSTAARQATADEGTNGDSPFPKQYLLNKMFSRESLGLAPETPANPAPAAKTP
jgi:hypothetical protein